MPEEKKYEVSDHFVDRLAEWGIHRIFGLPGDGINGLLGALQRAGDKFEFVQVAHEEVSALAACAHAKFTGELGVCMATSGPGAIHLLNGLYDAKMDRQPVLAIVGQQDAAALGSEFQQEIDLVALMRDVASAYVQQVIDPAQVRHVIDRAIRIALAERTVTCIIIPHDIQKKPAVTKQPHEHGSMHSSVGYSRPRVVAKDDDLRRAADIINAGKRVAILVGAGALGASEAVSRVAETTGAGVAKALLGKATLPDDLPFVTGTVGWLGTKASDRMMKECDTLLMIGTSFPYTEFLPEEGQARAVQIDRDARRMGLRYPTEINLVGDADETLTALLPLLRKTADRSWRQRVEALIAESKRELEDHAHADAQPLNPELLFFELNKLLPANAILTADCGSSTVWYARYLQIQRGMMATLSGTLDDGQCCSIRACGEVRPSRSSGDRRARRRRNADDRQHRAHQRCQVLAALG
jgi:pyruvate dehydrogenase (quinone)